MRGFENTFTHPVIGHDDRAITRRGMLAAKKKKMRPQKKANPTSDTSTTSLKYGRVARSHVQTEPQRNHLPHPLPLFFGPRLECLCACLAFGLFGAPTRAAEWLAQVVERLPELLGDIERVRAPTLVVKEVVLCREGDEL